MSRGLRTGGPAVADDVVTMMREAVAAVSALRNARGGSCYASCERCAVIVQMPPWLRACTADNADRTGAPLTPSPPAVRQSPQDDAARPSRATTYITNKEMWRLLQDVAASGVELQDPRISYVTVQIDRDTWQRLTDIFHTEEPQEQPFCGWCGRAIYLQLPEGRWEAVKGRERGYDPIACEANTDDGRHEP